MYCATPLNLKVCASTTTAVTPAATSCGTYKFINAVVLTTNTTCPVGEMQLTTANEFAIGTASPFTLTLQEGVLIASAILGAWALGFAIKSLKRAINGGSPE